MTRVEYFKSDLADVTEVIRKLKKLEYEQGLSDDQAKLLELLQKLARHLNIELQGRPVSRRRGIKRGCNGKPCGK